MAVAHFMSFSACWRAHIANKWLLHCIWWLRLVHSSVACIGLVKVDISFMLRLVTAFHATTGHRRLTTVAHRQLYDVAVIRDYICGSRNPSSEVAACSNLLITEDWNAGFVLWLLHSFEWLKYAFMGCSSVVFQRIYCRRQAHVHKECDKYCSELLDRFPSITLSIVVCPIRPAVSRPTYHHSCNLYIQELSISAGCHFMQ